MVEEEEEEEEEVEIMLVSPFALEAWSFIHLPCGLDDGKRCNSFAREDSLWRNALFGDNSSTSALLSNQHLHLPSLCRFFEPIATQLALRLHLQNLQHLVMVLHASLGR